MMTIIIIKFNGKRKESRMYSRYNAFRNHLFISEWNTKNSITQWGKCVHCDEAYFDWLKYLLLISSRNPV